MNFAALIFVWFGFGLAILWIFRLLVIVLFVLICFVGVFGLLVVGLLVVWLIDLLNSVAIFVGSLVFGLLFTYYLVVV